MLHTLRHLFPLAVALMLLTAGCDSAGDDGGDAAYLGTWYTQERDQYMEITESEIRVYATFTSDCYSTFTFAVADRDGESWELADGDVLEVSVDGDELTLVEDDGDVVHWTSTDVDPEDELNLC